MSRTRHDLETLLESVYVKCNPAKLLSTPGFVKDVLDKYEGYHDCLVTKLKDKYDRIASFEIQKLDTFITSNQKNGSLPRRNSREWASKVRESKSRDVKSRLLRAIYEKCNPEKLSQPGWLESVVTKYDGYDDVLIQRLEQKYCQTAPNEIGALKAYLKQDSRPKRVSQAWAMEARDAMQRREEERKSQTIEQTMPIRSRKRPPPKPKGRVSFSELLEVRRRDSEKPPGTPPLPFVPDAPEDYKDRAMSENTMKEEWKNLNDNVSTTLNRIVAPPPPPSSPLTQENNLDAPPGTPIPPAPSTPIGEDDELAFFVPPTPPPPPPAVTSTSGPPKPPPRGKIRDNMAPSTPDVSKKPSFASLKVLSQSDLSNHVVMPHTSRAELDEDARYIAMLPSDPSVGSFFQSASNSSASSRVRAISRLQRHENTTPLPMLPTEPGVGSFSMGETKAAYRAEQSRKFSLTEPHYLRHYPSSDTIEEERKMAQMLREDFPRRGSVVSNQGSVASNRSEKFKRFSSSQPLGVIVDDREFEVGGKVEETRPREASMYGSPTAAARRAERMRKYSTASSSDAHYGGEIVMGRVEAMRPREASVYVVKSPTVAARRAERIRKYSSTNSSSSSTFHESEEKRVEAIRPREASLHDRGSLTAAARRSQRMRKYSSSSTTTSNENIPTGPPGRLSGMRERVASSLNGSESSRRSLKESLTSPIVLEGERKRYISMDEGVTPLNDETTIFENEYTTPSLSNTRVSKEQRRRGTAFLNPAPVKVQWVGAFPDSPPGLCENQVVHVDRAVQEDLTPIKLSASSTNPRGATKPRQRRASVARVLDEATTWRKYTPHKSTFYHTPSPIRTRKAVVRSLPKSSSSYVSSKTLDEELEETMKLLKIAKMGGAIEISRRDEEKYKRLKEHLRSPPPLSPFGYAVNSSASKRAYRAYMTASATLRTAIRT